MFGAMKIGLLGATLLLLLADASCDSQEEKDRTTVQSQQVIYAKVHPVPIFDFSPQRQLWIDYYKSQTAMHNYWWYDINPGQADPVAMGVAIGVPTPNDTQLTNPLQHISGTGAVVEQAEPNGLFTGRNTDATIVWRLGADGTITPYYSEGKIRSTSWPSRWDYEKHWIVDISDAKDKGTVHLKFKEKVE